MEKRFNRFLSIVLALVMSSSTALTVSSEAVPVESPDEPAVIEWTEETQTDEFEIRSDVVGEENESKDKQESASSDIEPAVSLSEKIKDFAANLLPAKSGSGDDSEIETGTTGDCTWTYDPAAKTLTISGEGKMRNYSYSNLPPWNKKPIEIIKIENGVEYIGSFAFENCTGLSNIVIPDSVKGIGKYAFVECTGLDSIVIPNSVTSIGDHVFYDCTGLTSVVISNSINSLSDHAFSGCKGLTSVVIPDSITRIGTSVFSDCRELTRIDIPDSVKSIGENAFNGCTGLTSIDIPDSVTSIGNDAFSSCTGLTNIAIPDSLKDIAVGVFSYCTGLTNVNIPNSVNSIGYHAFYGCTGLKSIDIPDSVTSIGDSAFNRCTGLTSIAIPDSVTSIGSSAFSHCENVTSIKLSKSINKIGYGWFSYCTSLTNFAVPDFITDIGSYAFQNCTGLTSVDIADSVTSIGNHVFENCTELKSIDIPESVTSIGYVSFSGCAKLTSIDIPKSITSIDCVFSGCTGLTSIDIPDSVTSIGDSAFNSCTGLTNIDIPDSVTSIGENAFKCCYGLTSIKIPDSVTSIGKCAFDGCSGLTSITIPDSVKSIGDDAFEHCTKLTSIKLSKSIDKIGRGWFNNCESLMSFNIPDFITSIDDCAFYYCSGLKSIVIPDSVTSIGSCAFSYCTELKSIVIPDSVTSIGKDVFHDRRSHKLWCKDFKIYCVPGSTAWEYATENNIDVELISVSEYDGTLTLNIGEQYIGAKIKVVSHDQFGKKRIEAVRLIDKTPVSVYGLDPTMTYKAEVYNDMGTVFGTLDNIALTDKSADITISDLKEICDITAAVKNEYGLDVTDLCNIKWFTENGKYISTGAKLSNAAKGDVFKYTVEFKNSVLRDNYVIPNEQTIIAGSANAECVLEAYPIVYFRGKVTDEDGKAIANAGVSLAQTLSDDNIKTFSALTDDNGLFVFSAKNLLSQLIVKKDGFEIYNEEFSSISDEEKCITLNKFETASVGFKLTVHELDSTPKGTDHYSLYNIELVNDTTGKEVVNFKTESSKLIIPLNEVTVGDKLTVKSLADGFEPSSSSFVYGIDDSVALSIVSKGRIVINRVGDDLKTDMAIVFDSNGKYVKTITMKKAIAYFDSAKAGKYTIIFMNKNDRYYSPSSLAEFNSYELEEGKDYSKAEAVAENAITTELNSVTVPVINDAKTSYLNLDETSISANKTTLPLGQYYVLTIKYAFEKSVPDITNAAIALTIPEQLEAKSNCVSIDGKSADFTLSNGTVTIPFSKRSGTVIVALKAMASCDLCTVTSKIVFENKGSNITEALGSVNCSLESFDYYLPETVNTTSVYSSGTTFANSKVDYYDNDVLVGTTNSNASGSYEILFDLNNRYRSSIHCVYCIVTNKSGEVFKSSEKRVSYNVDAVVADKLIVHSEFNHKKGASLSIQFNNKQEKSLHYFFNPYEPTFTYELSVSGDATKVTEAEVITKTSKGQYIRVPLSYDKNTGHFVGSYDYTTETRPTTISVNIMYEQELLIDYNEIKDAQKKLQNYSNEYNNAVSDLQSSMKELQDASKVTKEQLISYYKEFGLTDEAISLIDIDGLVQSVNSEFTVRLDDIQQVRSNLYNEMKPQIDEAKASISTNSSTYGQVKTLSDSVSVQSLYNQGYEQVKTYDDEALIFEKGNSSDEYEYVNLTEGFSVVYSESSPITKMPNSSGVALDIHDSGYKPCPVNNIPDIKKYMTKLQNEVDSFTDEAAEDISSVMKMVNAGDEYIELVKTFQTSNLIITTAGLPIVSLLGSGSSENVDVIELNQEIVDFGYGTIEVGAGKEIEEKFTDILTKVGYNKNVEKYLDAFNKVNDKVNKVLGFADEIHEIVYELYDFISIAVELKSVLNKCCGCMVDSLYYLHGALNILRETIKFYVAYYGKELIPKVGKLADAFLGILSVGFKTMAWLTDASYDTLQKVTEPIEYKKRKARELIIKAQGYFYQCKCEGNGNSGLNLPSGVDPSGYICETVPSNRIEGVTATLFYSESSTGENAILWDASQYEQENPLLSDENGHYEWYVPEGWWQVKFEKAGYETTYSDWVPVLPIQTEVNVEMKSLYAPTVKNLNVFTDSVDITFSHYVEVDSVTGENITIEMGGNNVSGTIVPLNEEAGFSNSNVLYASKFRFIPDQTLSGDVTVNAEKIKASNGLYMDTPYSETKTAEEKIESVNVPENITMKYDASTDVEITLLPAAAGANKTISVRSSSEKLLSVENNTVVTDENGKATVTITGHMPAHAELTFTVDGYDISAVTNVELSTNDPVDELAAALAITPEGSACFGKIVNTKVSINGGTAPYMYKLEMIDDNGESETLYTHHFHELSDDDSSMMFNKMCNKAGHFTFKATVTDAAGQVSTDTKEINVHQASITDITPDKTSAFVGDTIVFTPSTMHLSPDMAQYCNYKYTVTKDGVSTEFLYPEKSSLSFIPTKSGEYTITLTIADVLGNTIAEKSIAYNVDEITTDEVTIYYKGYANPNIHYRTAGGAWTEVPGVAMTPSNEIDGFTHKYTIALDGAEYIEACFNDGHGNWDSQNGKNYIFTQGTYKFENGTITPFDFSSFTATLSVPGSELLSGDTMNISCSVQGGTAPYTYQFVRKPTGYDEYIIKDYSSDNNMDLRCDTAYWERIGDSVITVNVMDANGNIAIASETVAYKRLSAEFNVDKINSAPGETVKLSLNTNGTFHTAYLKYYVYDGENWTELATKSDNTADWTPAQAGEYQLKCGIYDGTTQWTNCFSEYSMNYTVVDDPTPENIITIYYNGYATPNIHYQVGNGSWTNVPGVTMTPTNEVAGYTHKYTIDLGDADYANVCFNDGHNNWDSRNGANYRFTKGTYKFSTGTITAM